MNDEKALKLKSTLTPSDEDDFSMEDTPALPPRPQTTAPSSTWATEISEPDSLWAEKTDKSRWKSAFDEAQYLAGGLFTHPYESTKHFTILRHSPALVWYRGPTTCVAITIFSDAPLPPERKVWLQRKGFSGNTGMNLKALVGTTASWIDVTPVAGADVSAVPENDERCWQRDIKRFHKKAPGNLAGHITRETHVIRIPGAAADGYFRLLLCVQEEEGGKKKILCPSPVIRIASTSTDSSVIRGADLATMPLEVGVKVASTIGATALTRFVSPVTGVVASRIQKYQPSYISRKAGQLAYSTSGLEQRFSGMNEKHEESRESRFNAAEPGETPYVVPDVIGSESGPEKPFPIQFTGRTANSTNPGVDHAGYPVTNVVDVPQHVALRLKGVFFGWAALLLSKGNENTSQVWQEAIVTVAPPIQKTASVAPKNVVRIHIIHDYGQGALPDAKLKVILLGYIREATPAEPSELAEAVAARDSLVTLASLSRANWGPEEAIQKTKLLRSQRSFDSKYADAREAFQKRMDSIPMHWVGIRAPGSTNRDQLHGNGGYWIQR